jgi:hypothetical protein
LRVEVNFEREASSSVEATQLVVDALFLWDAAIL